ncbi:MAG: hypothetical protein DRQ40_09765 [Gammaproteobacteria bacterium]|nr:MAG: hypothetical protein DRQ40_09765 [Gammaproteobacteria bacterium]
MNPNQTYYDPASEQDGRTGDGIVLKSRPFKPLRNRKTLNFFSYSYDLAERHKSSNGNSNIQWVYGAPEEMQKRIDTVSSMHDVTVDLHADLVQAMKDEDKPAIRKATAAIKTQTEAIDEFIYPESEHEYVESKEAKRFRLEQQNELTLDAASIAALRGEVAAPMGSTADASIAQAKLEVAMKRIAELEAEPVPVAVESVPVETDETPWS